VVQKFALGDLIYGYNGLVQRLSVLYQLHRHGPPAELPDKVQKLRTLWQCRVRALNEAQWSGLRAAHSSRFLWMLACPTAFAEIHPQPERFLTCNLHRLCPFCWASEAGDLWRRLDAKLYSGDRYPGEVTYDEEGRRLLPSCLPNHDLAVRTQTYTLATTDVDFAQRFLELRIAGRQGPSPMLPRWKKLEQLRAAGVLGTLDITRIEPYFKDQAPGQEPAHVGWQLVVRQLLVIPHAQYDAVLSHPAFAPVESGPRVQCAQTLRRYARPTRKQFASQVARALAYPRHLLFGDINLAMAALDMVKGRRWISPVGLFYGQSETSEFAED
jgi:hypothetical protein